jgi:hypothetical protein
LVELEAVVDHITQFVPSGRKANAPEFAAVRGKVRDRKNTLVDAVRGQRALAVVATGVVFELLETRQLMTAFGFSGSVETYTVPATGLYEISAAGAQGGSRTGGPTGGVGAVLTGEVTLNAGTQLDVVVGGAGISDAVGGHGGGGGSFVYLVGAPQPLVVAGGGGGGSASGGNGGVGQTGQSGDNAQPIPLDRNLGQGGSGGNGGTAGSGGVGDAGGGGGWLSPGTSNSNNDGNTGGLGGDGPPSFAGGQGDSYDVNDSGGPYPIPNGGFGGGGGGGSAGGGGGGGYSGGGGGDGSFDQGSAGGGGGSYFNSSVTSTTTADTQTGNGVVSISGVLVVNSQTVAVSYERTATVLLSANEPGATLSYSIVKQPADGILSGFNASTGTVRYTPLSGFVGTDSFNFSVSDGTASATGTVTLNVAASTTAPWMSTQSDSIPLSDLSLPGTYQSASGPNLTDALFGNGSSNVVSTGPLAESDEALHIAASLTTATISSATAANNDNPVLDAAGATADAAASSADAAEDHAGDNVGVGLGLSLASDITTEASDAYTIAQDAATALDSLNDKTTTPMDAAEEGDATTEATEHSTAVTANTPATAADGASLTTNGAAATTDGSTGAMTATAGGENGLAGTLNASTIITTTVAEGEGGVDPAADEIASGDEATSSAEDEEAAATDLSTDADADAVTADVDNGLAITDNQLGTAANTGAETADGNADDADGAAETLSTNLIQALNNSATSHTKTAVADGLTAGYMGAGSVSDAYTASNFHTFYTGLSNPDTTGGNSVNSGIQSTVYKDAVAEFATHTASATAEAAAATADGVAAGLDAAAATADSAAVMAFQALLAANANAATANQMAVEFEQQAEAADEEAAMEEAAAETSNMMSIATNTTAGVNNGIAGVSNAIDAAANSGAGAADLAAEVLDGVLAGTVTGAGGLTTVPVLTYTGTGTTVYSASSTAPTNAGTYSVTGTYAGDANHTTGTSGPVLFTIAQATPVITVTDNGGVFTGLPYAATGTSTGVNGVNLGSPTFQYFLASDTAFKNASSTAPTNVGSYVVIGSSPLSGNYVQVTLSRSFSITPANTTITLKSSTSGVSYYGQSVTFTATVSSSASVTPAGSVQFFSGSTSLGTETLVNGSASLTTTALSIAGDQVTVDFLPSTPNFNSSTTSITQTVSVGIVLLDQKNAGALTVSGAAKVNANGSSIVVDSSNSQAIEVTGSGVVSSNQTDVVGGAYVQPYSGTATNLFTAQASVADPLGSLATPATTGLTAQSKATLVVGGSSVVTLQPGVYVGGININGAAKVTFAPGIYYLQGGGLKIGGSASVTGQGVLIYNAAVATSDQINISGAASLKLTPMATGTWAGITLFQTRSSNAAIVVSGSGTVNVTGTVYAASATVDIAGAGAVDTFGSSLIADDLNVSGSGELLV